MLRTIKNIRGFTLTELMVVVTILGLIIVLTIPSFGRFLQSSRLAGEINKMSLTFRAARSAAITKNIDAVFVLDTAKNEYFYFEDRNGDGQKNAGELQSAVVELPPGIVFQGHTLTQPKVFFSPKGTATESGTITIKNTRNHARTLRIFGGTGNVSIQ
ncbi:MAG: prepilin-type N-terminal cleavage/methylation domain-containing protein [Candidatus Latescibacteria bacterium]|nr:prepilin-type N-terminal cleavage/methylation domain-containing protein [Candidatus Latescibacterota bacterium]NIO29090.1 prepilin-type N-terminal cleavage/methylation domain-containing protein [Candidatus Latescibacterota bacterium]NIO56715.1 prepilin-type N-terminal cleavage/methylation domain-containing protein [Candidatus Latescibacterota bacterium]NIT02298.1 prepilin-type N-terminal cleavage/methylation domain-containing protein [Candidatus Latescibacterota bacterium]NIT39183.1 prepilin